MAVGSSSSVKKSVENDRKKKVCVECGSTAEKAYKELRGGIIRLSHCELCSSIVDKYIEYDPILIILDILLHKEQAYRHLLFNRRVDIHWQLSVVFLLCDAYIKWWYLKHFDYVNNTNSKHSKNQEISLLELQFYVMLCAAVVEFVAFLAFTYNVLKLVSVTTGKIANSSFKDISLALLGSSFAKTFVVPVVLWGSNEMGVFLPLTRLLVMTSNSESLKVLLNISFVRAFIVVLFANIFVLFLSYSLIDRIIDLVFMQYI